MVNTGVRGKVMFSLVCVILFTGSGGGSVDLGPRIVDPPNDQEMDGIGKRQFANNHDQTGFNFKGPFPSRFNIPQIPLAELRLQQFPRLGDTNSDNEGTDEPEDKIEETQDAMPEETQDAMASGAAGTNEVEDQGDDQVIDEIEDEPLVSRRNYKLESSEEECGVKIGQFTLYIIHYFQGKYSSLNFLLGSCSNIKFSL